MGPETHNLVPGRAPRAALWRAGLLLLVVAAVAVGAGPVAAASKHHHRPPPPAVVAGRPAPAGTISVSGVSCATALVCWSVGAGAAPGGASSVGAISVSRDAGTTWSAQVAPAGVVSLAAISCPTRLRCLAGGATATAGAVVSTKDGGKTWVLDHSPPGALDVNGVQCTSGGGCLALFTDGTVYASASSNDYGETWTVGGTLPATLLGAGGLSCQGTERCIVAGYTPTAPGQGTGALASTTDGGATWSSVTLPPGVGLLHGVACAKRTCLAVGTTVTNDIDVVPGKGVILTSADDGLTWSAEPHSTAVGDAFAVSCTPALACVIVGTVWIPVTPPTPVGGVITSTDGGTTWRPATLRFVPEPMVAVDCPSAATCVAAGAHVLAHVALPVKKKKQKPAGLGI